MTYFSSLNEFARESAPYCPILFLLLDLKKKHVEINEFDYEKESAMKLREIAEKVSAALNGE